MASVRILYFMLQILVFVQLPAYPDFYQCLVDERQRSISSLDTIDTNHLHYLNIYTTCM
jgi:hypothetical protein